ncbi:hypothetical protein E2C01_033803 [Portunus trituberculatus]|uniref:Uncharacterized protein n=1 Tax=Portunus trituberculatus TaxID=210409 RepID=A0A5B7F3W5_PORTR|nr:hypothetical protein [Portunus trituberculatus]
MPLKSTIYTGIRTNPSSPRIRPSSPCGCEDSDDATLPFFIRHTVSNDPPHITPPATVMK